MTGYRPQVLYVGRYFLYEGDRSIRILMPSYSFFPSEKECEALKNAFGSGRIVQPIATTDASSDSTVLLRLSPEHRHYLLRRHGTLDLDPVPGPKDDDPYNWPRWKVKPLPEHASLFELILTVGGHAENDRPDFGLLSCHDVHLHGGIYHSCL